MEESLRRNELRPFEYIKNYSQEIQQLSNRPGPESEVALEGLKILSASPFRATVKMDQQYVTNEQEENSDDEEFARDGTFKETSPMTLLRNRKVSPIRGESEEKR